MVRLIIRFRRITNPIVSACRCLGDLRRYFSRPTTSFICLHLFSHRCYKPVRNALNGRKLRGWWRCWCDKVDSTERQPLNQWGGLWCSPHPTHPVQDLNRLGFVNWFWAKVIYPRLQWYRRRQCAKHGHLWDGKPVEYREIVMAGEYVKIYWSVACNHCGGTRDATWGEVREHTSLELYYLEQRDIERSRG